MLRTIALMSATLGILVESHALAACRLHYFSRDDGDGSVRGTCSVNLTERTNVDRRPALSAWMRGYGESQRLQTSGLRVSDDDNGRRTVRGTLRVSAANWDSCRVEVFLRVGGRTHTLHRGWLPGCR